MHMHMLTLTLTYTYAYIYVCMYEQVAMRKDLRSPPLDVLLLRAALRRGM